MVYTERKEASVTQAILTQLDNLGWAVDEREPDCNVFQQRAKTQEQARRLHGKFPDFTLYQERTNTPIAIIEAKRPSESLLYALDQAEERYARPLGVPLIFAYNDTYVATRYLHNGRPLKIDGEDVRQFVNHYTALRFVHEGSEILSAPERVQYSREQLIAIFKHTSELLREAGLEKGLERFGAFSDILFLKIMDEVCELTVHAGEIPPLEEHVRWSNFQDMAPDAMHTYVREVVWGAMNKKYGIIFSETLPIDSPQILHEVVRKVSDLHLTAADTDVKGDAFEYFLRNAYQGVRTKDLGEYFTPRDVVRTMVSMVDPQIGEKIYDPFCGTGGFLIESFRYLRLRTRNRAQWDDTLRNRTVYGSEITNVVRVAKMNMILFGDGHNNIEKEDSLSNPKRGAFDVVLTNPPYSQKTRYGNLYTVPTQNADPVCVAHCLDALKEGGRAAFLVKEDFLTDGGQSKALRERILREAKDMTIVSLPRRLFEPYTPTKTSILYLEKGGHRNSTYFFVVNRVGRTLGPRSKPIAENDLPTVLDAFNEGQCPPQVDSVILDNDVIRGAQHSLWLYDYIEKVPVLPFSMEPLGAFIEPSGEQVDPQDYPDEEFRILGVSKQHGIFENDVIIGSEITQNYIRVQAGDLVYNPHRVNLGSIGIVTEAHAGGYVSPIYVVFRSTDQRMPATLIWSLLRSEMYKDVIRAYDTRHGAVRPNLVWTQLARIRVPILGSTEMTDFLLRQAEWNRLANELEETERRMSRFVEGLEHEKGSGGRPDRPVKLPGDFDTAMDALLAVKPKKKRGK